jgi:hypothetical protein
LLTNAGERDSAGRTLGIKSINAREASPPGGVLVQTKEINMKWFRHFEILLTFAAHILTAIAVFCIVGLGAWSLHLVRHFLQQQGLDEFVLIGLHGIELLLFACDVLATGFWAIMSTMTAIKLMKEK